MPLIARHQSGALFVGGTAFVIGPGWAITAFHVLDEFLRRYECLSPEGDLTVGFEILTYLTLDQGQRILPLRILKTWRSAPLDLALLAVGLPADSPDGHRWTVPMISLLPPRKGTPIFAFGFTKGLVSREAGDAAPTLSVDSHTSTGEVLEIHHEVRDRAMLPFPCFRTNARFDPGMSGGPVFDNTTGRVCGVVCSGIPGTVDEGGYVSYASSLWPIVATHVDVTETHWTGGEARPAMTLFEQGLFHAPDLDRVRVIPGPDGVPQAEAAYDRSDLDGEKAVG